MQGKEVEMMVNRIIPWVMVILLGMNLSLIGCKKTTVPENVDYYTCPMHPQIKRDAPGQCPICAMNLVPVLKGPGGESKEKQGTHEEKTKQEGLFIDPRRIQTIGVKTEAVEYRELEKTLMVQGKVAHDPKLWVAQKEYLIALKLGDRSLIKSAEEKLYFMGLSKDWIRLIKKSGNADLGFHLPVPGKPTFFEAFINQSDVALIHPGEKVKILGTKSRLLGEGVVRSLGTMVDLDSRTVRALIQADQFLNLKSNTFVQLEISLGLGKQLAIPKSAVLFNGDYNMVYVQTEPGWFVGKKVEIGQEAGGFYEIKEGLKEGEKVVVNGQFLLDSETQMRGETINLHQH